MNIIKLVAKVLWTLLKLFLLCMVSAVISDIIWYSALGKTSPVWLAVITGGFIGLFHEEIYHDLCLGVQKLLNRFRKKEVDGGANK